MFLKINFKEESKKIIFKESYQNINGLKSVVSKIAKLPVEEFHLYDEQSPLKTDEDIFKFISKEGKNKKFKELRVVETKDLKEEEEAKELVEDKGDKGSSLGVEVENKPIDVPVETKEVDKPNQPVNVELIDKHDTLSENSSEEEPLIEDIDDIDVDIANIEPKYDKLIEDNKNRESKEDKREMKIEKEIKKMIKLREKMEMSKGRAQKRAYKRLKRKVDKLIIQESKRKQQEIRKKQKEAQKALKKEAKKKKQEDKKGSKLNVHVNVQCDICSMFPIVGKRFICMVRPDYDLCERCESTNPYSHPMLRLNSPANPSEVDRIKATFEENKDLLPVDCENNIDNLEKVEKKFDEEEKIKLLIELFGNKLDQDLRKSIANSFKEQGREEFKENVQMLFGDVL